MTDIHRMFCLKLTIDSIVSYMISPGLVCLYLLTEQQRYILPPIIKACRYIYKSNPVVDTHVSWG